MPSPTPTVTPDEAAALIGSTDTFAIPLGPGIPSELMHALGRRERFDDLQVFGALLVDLYELFTRPGVTYRSGFYGPAERFLLASGANIEFVPADFRRFTPLVRALSPRVMATVATPPDRDGYMSLSLHAGATVDELHRAGASPERLLIVEIDPRYPRTFGLPPEHRHAIHVSEADAILESDREPFVLADVEATSVEHAIADHALEFIPDGATLQTGIGGIPSTIAGLLAERPGGGYGIHSEMFTTGLMHLHRADKVTNDKGEYDGMSVCTFAAGTLELYEWLDGNPDVRFLPVEHINNPDLIAHNHHMVTINGAISVDLAGQAMADTVGGHQFSGIGGHEDFVGGGSLQADDRSLVCLPSTATVDGISVSRIVSGFGPGSIITTPRHQLDVVITEHGAADLRLKTVRERALALAEIAEPAFRDDLREAAARMD